MARYIVSFMHRIMDRLVVNSCRKELKLAAFKNRMACTDILCDLQLNQNKLTSAMKGSHE